MPAFTKAEHQRRHPQGDHDRCRWCTLQFRAEELELVVMNDASLHHEYEGIVEDVRVWSLKWRKRATLRDRCVWYPIRHLVRRAAQAERDYTGAPLFSAAVQREAVRILGRDVLHAVDEKLGAKAKK